MESYYMDNDIEANAMCIASECLEELYREEVSSQFCEGELTIAVIYDCEGNIL